MIVVVLVVLLCLYIERERKREAWLRGAASFALLSLPFGSSDEPRVRQTRCTYQTATLKYDYGNITMKLLLNY